MPWPTPQDYNEAIQNPNLCFSDPELKLGNPECNMLGLPRPICGGFASVYRLSCGQRDWAIRCFLREFIDQERRYAAISNHLAAVKLPYTVGFEFLPKGIKVGKEWYPILKMEWVKGELLHDYIKRHITDSNTLLQLANKWQAMIKALNEANIGHGDFQHGNILVVNGDLRLIDYDGMYVPSLAGQLSHEVGHRNYQHPLRSESDFGAFLDHFSSWVIYISIIALSIDHELWRKVGCGEEFILFRKEDFVDPDTSHTFGLLTNHLDSRIQSLITLFRSLLFLGPQQIPPLNNQPASLFTPVTRSLPPSIDWLADHVKDQSEQKTRSNILAPYLPDRSTTTFQPAENSTWVLDYISEPETDYPELFTATLTIPRITTLFTACLLTLVLIALPISELLFLLACALFIPIWFINKWILQYYYRQDPAVAQRETIMMREEREDRLLNFLQRDFQNRQSQKKNLLVEENRKRLTLVNDASALQEKERVDKSNVESYLRQAISSINGRRLVFNQQEADAIRKVQQSVENEVVKLTGQIASLNQAESDETQRLLQAKQVQFLKDYLSKYRIIDAEISGVGDKLKARLRASGIHTAADIHYWRVTAVDGIGSNKGSALVAWRDFLINRIKPQVPGALSQSEQDMIRSIFESQRQQLESKKAAMRQQLSAQEITIKDQYVKLRISLDSEQSSVQDKARQDLEGIIRRYKQAYDDFSQNLVKLATETQKATQKLDEQIARLQKQMFDSHWRLARVRRELKMYERLSFRNYIRLILLGRYANV